VYPTPPSIIGNAAGPFLRFLRTFFQRFSVLEEPQGPLRRIRRLRRTFHPAGPILLTHPGCPTSRSFFARCGIPLLFHRNSSGPISFLGRGGTRTGPLRRIRRLRRTLPPRSPHLPSYPDPQEIGRVPHVRHSVHGPKTMGAAPRPHFTQSTTNQKDDKFDTIPLLP
jgi:hypothetical protein